MKGQFAAISYSLYVELKYLMIRFWTILLAFVVVDILVFSQVNEHLLLVTSMPQYIFSGIVSFIIIRKSFSFCFICTCNVPYQCCHHEHFNKGD